LSEPTEPVAPPTPSQDPLAAHYFVHDGGGVIGPITGEKLKEMIEAGAISREADFNRVGEPDWVSALRFPPFAGFFKATPPPPPDVFAQRRPQTRTSEGPRVYATFWKRLAAYGLDAVILAICGFMLALVITIFAVASSGAEAAKETIEQHDLLFNGIGALVGIFYYVHFLSSPQQATPGKRIMGIYVIRKDGARLSPLFALGRYLAAALSALPLGFGFLMILWTKDRQGLHDMLCGTYVVEGKL
jgi:uncharacterized RDD family membrane protein YckC